MGNCHAEKFKSITFSWNAIVALPFPCLKSGQYFTALTVNYKLDNN